MQLDLPSALTQCFGDRSLYASLGNRYHKLSLSVCKSANACSKRCWVQNAYIKSHTSVSKELKDNNLLFFQPSASNLKFIPLVHERRRTKLEIKMVEPVCLLLQMYMHNTTAVTFLSDH